MAIGMKSPEVRKFEDIAIREMKHCAKDRTRVCFILRDPNSKTYTNQSGGSLEEMVEKDLEAENTSHWIDSEKVIDLVSENEDTTTRLLFEEILQKKKIINIHFTVLLKMIEYLLLFSTPLFLVEK